MGKKNAIIIIEDDADDQEVLREVLQELGVKNELLFFNDCDKAYSYLMSSTEKPFLILCDINLPRMNGIELKRKIDNTDFLRRKVIPFIFLTTSDKQSTVDAAYHGANLQGYFKKGDSMQEIRDKLKCIVQYWSEALHPDET